MHTPFNGRIDLLSPPAMTSGGITPDPRPGGGGAPDTFAAEALNGQLSRTQLSDLFFSATNVAAVQQGLRYKVFQRTGKVIGQQSETDLKVVMRSIFLQHARHQPHGIVEQVRVLNGLVLDWCVPEVVGSLSQHVRYRVDASTLPMPMERGQIASAKGTKALEHRPFL